VRKILSPGSIASMPYLCNDRGYELETWAKEGVASVLASESASTLPESSAFSGDPHWKLRATQEERESERS